MSGATLVELLLDGLTVLLPKPWADELPHQYAWRSRVQFVACVSFLISIVLGVMMYMVYVQVEAIRAASLKVEMRNELIHECNLGTTPSDKALYAFLAAEIVRQENQYFRITKNGYPQPTCQQLGQ